MASVKVLDRVNTDRWCRIELCDHARRKAGSRYTVTLLRRGTDEVLLERGYDTEHKAWMGYRRMVRERTAGQVS